MTRGTRGQLRRRLSRHLEILIEVLGGLLLVALVLCICVSVFDRYVLKAGTGWAGEATEIIFVWLSFVGYAIALRRRLNVALEIATTRMRAKLQRYIRLLQDLCVLAFVGLFTQQSFATVRFAAMERLPGLHISMVWLYAAVPTAGIVMVIWALENLFQQATSEAPNKQALPRKTASTRDGSSKS